MKISAKKNKLVLVVACLFAAMILLPNHHPLFADEPQLDLLDDEFYGDDYESMEYGQEGAEISDPLEPMNRVFFEVNDVLYYWVFKPVKTGYSTVVPYDVRYMFGNFFHNLASPIRLVNNLLQGDFEDAGVVVSRFAINTTMGVFGFGDPAGREFRIAPRPADFGQTLGKWGVGEGVYFNWPFIGPSTVRDSVGLVGDAYTHPFGYIYPGIYEGAVYYMGTRVNSMSLQPDVYEELKKVSVDPYVAMRQAYFDYRRGMLMEVHEGDE